jgi:hypothetical protein
VAEIEVGEMAANYIIVRRCSAEIAGILHASRDHRVGIDSGDTGEKPGGSGGTCGRESKIVADISPGPKRGGQNLGSVQDGQREMAGHVLPAGASDHCRDEHSYQGPLKAQTTPIPAPPSSHGLSNGSVVQNSTPTPALSRWAAGESQL